jgi:hypothetical protein
VGLSTRQRRHLRLRVAVRRQWNTKVCIPLKENGESRSNANECKGRCDLDAGQCVDICGGTM